MAKVSKVKDSKKPAQKRVVLDLGPREAEFLAGLVSSVQGSPWDTDVKHAERIRTALQSA